MGIKHHMQPPEGQQPPPNRDVRRERRLRYGANEDFEYCLGHNLVVMCGKVIRAVERFSSNVWFRLEVRDQDVPARTLWIYVQAAGNCKQHVLDNVHVGATVLVVGQLWNGRRDRHRFAYIQAERVSCSYPEQIDKDQRFVRVRLDHWESIKMKLAGEDGSAMERLLADYSTMAGLDDRIPDEPDDDPTQDNQ